MFVSVNGGMLPQRSTTHSAGFDVFANEYKEICVGSTEILSLGIAIGEESLNHLINSMPWEIVTSGIATIEEKREAFLKRYYLELHPRSSLRAKGLIVMPGIIDMDYRDEIKMIIFNGNAESKKFPDLAAHVDAVLNREKTCEKYFKIKKGDKVGQLIFKQHEGRFLPPEFTKDEKRTGGIGSTGE